MIKTKLSDTIRTGTNQAPTLDSDFVWTGLDAGMYILDATLLVVASSTNRAFACSFMPSVTPSVSSFVSGYTFPGSSSILKPITNPMPTTGTGNTLSLTIGTNTMIKLTGVLFAPSTIDLSFYWSSYLTGSGNITMRAGSTISVTGPF